MWPDVFHGDLVSRHTGPRIARDCRDHFSYYVQNDAACILISQAQIVAFSGSGS